MRRPMLLAAAAVLVASTGIAAAATKPKTVKIPAKLVFNGYSNESGCGVGVLIEFPARKGATSYTLRYTDAGVQAERTLPPFDSANDEQVALGTHRLGLAGFTTSDVRGCPNAEAGYRERFKNITATAVIDPQDGRIAGRVLFDGAGVKGVPVSAVGEKESTTRNGAAFRATTDGSGFYSITIPKANLGTYTLGADLSRKRLSDVSTRVYVDSGQTLNIDLNVPEPKPDDPAAVASVPIIQARDRSKPAKAEYRRGAGEFQALTTDTQLRRGDVVRTDGNTFAQVELDIGGRISIQPSSEIEVIDDRRASPADPPFKLTKGGVWAKCAAMREPLEIQTTGGVIGVKG
jgi:hypothetical protein